MNLLDQLVNSIKGLLGQGGGPQAPSPQIQQQVQPHNNPVLQGAANVQNYLEKNAAAPIPTFSDTQIHNTALNTTNDTVGQAAAKELGNAGKSIMPAAKAVANIPIGILNTIIGKGLLSTGADVGKIIQNLTQGQATNYKDLQSPAVKLGANMASEFNPGEESFKDVPGTPEALIGNAAGTVEPIIAAGGLNSAANLASGAVKNTGEESIKDLAMQGVKQGALQGGAYGAAQGLDENQEKPFKDQLIAGAANAALGAAGGAAIGGVTGGGASAFGKMTRQALQQHINEAVQDLPKEPNIVDIKPAFHALEGQDGDAIRGAVSVLDEDMQNPGGQNDIHAFTSKYLPGFSKEPAPVQRKIWEDLIGLKDDPSGLSERIASVNPALRDTIDHTFNKAKQAGQAGFIKIPGASDEEAAKEAALPENEQKAIEEITGVNPETQQVEGQVGTNTQKMPPLNQAGTLEGQDPLDQQFEQMKQEGEAGWDKRLNDRYDATTNEKLTPEQVATQNATENPQQPGVAAIDPANVAKQGRSARFAAMQQLNFRSALMANEERAVLGQDPVENELYRQALEHPDGTEWLASQSKDPEAFTNLVKQKQDFYDYALQAAKDNKVDMGTVKDYYTHILDLDTPEKEKAFNDFMAANAKNFNSPYTKNRTFMTLDQLRDAGFDIKDQPSYMDTVQYSRSMGTQIGANALNNKINELRPNGAVPIADNGTVPYNYKGQLFEQSNVPGNKGTFIDPEIQAHMSYYNKSAFADNPVVTLVDKVNTALKEIKLSGGLFHALRETLNYVGSTGKVQDLPTAARMFVDPGFANDEFQTLTDSGALDAASSMGIRLSDTSGIGGENNDMMQLLNSKDPIKQATFQRLINYYILKTVNNVPEDQRTPEMGKQIQALYNGLNSEVSGTNKTASQVARLGFLAPQFNLGKLINVITAIKGGNTPEAWFARRAIAGTAIGTAIEFEIANFALNHKLDLNPGSIFANGIVHPNVPLPYKSPTGKPLAMDLPGSDFSDLSKMVTTPGGVQHAITSRGGALISVANQLRTGQDYYGNPTSLGNIVQSQLPIPAVQLLNTTQNNPKTGQPKQNAETALLNTVGFRVHNDQNDPTVAAQTKYFNDIASAESDMTPAQKGIWNGIIFPTKKDANGNSLVDKNSETNPAYYSALLANPELLNKVISIEQGQPQHDPLWDLPTNQLHSALLYYQLKYSNPTGGFSSADPSLSPLANSLPKTFFQDRQNYFNGLIASGTMQPSQTSGPVTPKAISDFWSAYTALPYGSGDRKALLQSPIGQAALAWMSVEQNATNMTRADMGLPMLAAGGGSGGSTGYSSGGSSGGARLPRGAKSMPRGLNPYSRVKGLSRYATMKIAQPSIREGKKKVKSGVRLTLGGSKSINRYPKVASIQAPKLKTVKTVSGTMKSSKGGIKLMAYNPKIGLSGQKHIHS